MSTWTPRELQEVGDAEEILVSSTITDGILSKPVIVWVVGEGEDLYVRSVRGRDSRWFRGVQIGREGQIKAGSLVLDVGFVEELSQEINGAIDRAYAQKYRRYAASIIESINSPEARATTLRLQKI